MAIKEWSTNFSGANPVQDADPITGSMPDLDEETGLNAGDGDEMRTSQVEALRDKLQTVAKLVGDSANDPAGSLAEILDRDHAAGDARHVRLAERASAPAAVADKVFLYAKDDGGVAKAYIEWGDGTEKELGAASGGQTNTVAGANGITNTGNNVDATLAPTYGSSANTICQGDDSRLSDARTPTSHATSHQSGGGDAIKLDDLAAPDDNTDLDSTISAHGLLPKLGGGTTNFLRADGSWAAPVAGSSSPLTTKGDVWGYDTGDARVPVGTDGHVLQADSAQALGVKYAEVANASLADMAQATIKGRASGAGTGDPTDLTAAQATAILDAFTDALKGLAPASGGGTTNFLRADGTWAAPPGGGGGQTNTVAGSNGITNTGDNVNANLAPTYGAAANTICQGNDSRLSDARTPTGHAASHQSGGGDAIKLDDLSAPDDNTDLDATTGAHGLLPKLGGGTTNFLRADGSWAAPAGGGGGFTAYEQEFTAVTGANEFTLAATPAVNANTLSGRNILGVYRNGVRSRWRSTVTLSNEYNQTGGTDKINVVAQSGGEIIIVVYGV